MGEIRDIFAGVLLYDDLIIAIVFLLVFPYLLIHLERCYIKQEDGVMEWVAFSGLLVSIIIGIVYNLSLMKRNVWVFVVYLILIIMLRTIIISG